MTKGKKPDFVVRFKNLKVAVFSGGSPDLPCFVICRGFKGKGTDKWLNSELTCFLSDLEEYVKLFDLVIKKYGKQS